MAEKTGASSIHLDIFDPNYVGTDNMDIVTPGLMGELDKVLTIPKDAHLMVKPSTLGGLDKFKDYIRSFIENRAGFVAIHWGAFIKDGYGENEIRQTLKFIRLNGACAGLAINPDEDANELLKYKDDMDYPLAMTVVPGKGGNPFDERGLRNIEILESAGLDKIIAVDGSINGTTVTEVVGRGGKWLAVGSYYFGKGASLKSESEMRKAYESLINATTFPSHSKIKAVFFDVGNVLVFWSYEAIIDELVKHCDMKKEKIRRILNSKEYFFPYHAGKISPKDFFETVRKRLNLRNTIDYETFARIYSRKNDKPNPLAIESMKQLKKAGYRIYILSDVEELDLQYWRSVYPEIFDTADGVIASCEEGATKRDKDKKLFKIALKRAGISPDEAIYIDDVEKYLKTFVSLGVKNVIQYTPGMNLDSALNTLLGFSVSPEDIPARTLLHTKRAVTAILQAA